MPQRKPALTTIRQVWRLPALPPRRKDSHKGDFGRVLVIGGSRGMIGAPALVANAALRSGAGLVTVACPKAIQLAVATLCPCATSIPLPEDDAGRLDPVKSLDSLRKAAGGTRPTALAVGPGLGQGDSGFSRAVVALLVAVAEADGIPAVLDADALNALASCRAGFARLCKGAAGITAGGVRPTTRPMVLTPHPGEMGRLLGISTAAVQRDRQAAALKLANALAGGGGDDGAVVLKGANTVVTDGRKLYANRTGNPGMATGGAGDVLTGVIAALVGQGLTTFDAAVLGVHVHGLAGDLAAKDLGQISLTAADLIDCLPAAFRSYGSPRRHRKDR